MIDSESGDIGGDELICMKWNKSDRLNFKRLAKCIGKLVPVAR